jgi:hypothetical protein
LEPPGELACPLLGSGLSANETAHGVGVARSCSESDTGCRKHRGSVLVQTGLIADDGSMQPFSPVEALFKGRQFDGQIIILCVSWYPVSN